MIESGQQFCFFDKSRPPEIRAVLGFFADVVAFGMEDFDRDRAFKIGIGGDKNVRKPRRQEFFLNFIFADPFHRFRMPNAARTCKEKGRNMAAAPFDSSRRLLTTPAFRHLRR